MPINPGDLRTLLHVQSEKTTYGPTLSRVRG